MPKPPILEHESRLAPYLITGHRTGTLVLVGLFCHIDRSLLTLAWPLTGHRTALILCSLWNVSSMECVLYGTALPHGPLRGTTEQHLSEAQEVVRLLY